MSAPASPTPARLTVDHQHAPIGVAVHEPVLAWQVPGAAPATAYEVEVRRRDAATGEPLDPAVWATGRVEVPEPPMRPWLPYAGAPLVSDADYTWRVRVWTSAAGAGARPDGPAPIDGPEAIGAGASDASSPAPGPDAAGADARPAAPEPAPSDWAVSTFSTSLLEAADVASPWVEPEPPVSFETLFAPQDRPPAGDHLHPVKLARQELDLSARAGTGPDAALPAPITRARLYVSAQSVIDASIDGTPVGDTVLAPGWTSYHDYTEFEVHDVTGLLADTVDSADAVGSRHTLGLRLADLPTTA